MKITLKDGSVKEYASPMSIIDIAKDISEGLARVACLGEVDGEEEDLRTVIDHDCQLNILTAKDEADRNSIAGIKGGIIDMFALSKTNKIYGSFQSSFSELAAQIGNVPIEILQKD